MTLEIVIDGLGASGDGVGRLPDGRVVFVPEAIPGDRVAIRLTHARKRAQFAELVELVEPSPDRIESRCNVESCGGCALKHVSLARQASLKRERVVENLRRLAKIDIDEMLAPPLQLGDGWRYRHRVRLHAAWTGGRWQLGYFARRSHMLVPLTACPVLWPELEQAAHELGEGLARLGKGVKIDTVDLVYARRDGRAAVKIRGEASMRQFRKSLDWFEASGLSGVEIECGRERLRFGNLELRYDHGRAESFDLRYDPSVFTQIHPEINDALVAAVVGAVRPQSGPQVLELHAGIGNFTLPLARDGARVVAAEHNRRAVILARRNARALGRDVAVHDESDAEAIRHAADAELLLIDPPRAGARAVAQAVATAGPPRIVYVSCDSATFARDLSILVQGGYAMTSIDAFDMFPQTPHVETVARLERAS